MVTLIIAVYIFCWLPYWSFQLYIILAAPINFPQSVIFLYSFFTILSLINGQWSKLGLVLMVDFWSI